MPALQKNEVALMLDLMSHQTDHKILKMSPKFLMRMVLLSLNALGGPRNKKNRKRLKECYHRAVDALKAPIAAQRMG